MFQNLKIAIQKSGRLNNASLSLLRSIGIDIESYDRQLNAVCKSTGLEVMMLRDDDISEFVERGIVDLGIVGEDLIRESKSDVEIIRKLGFGKCQLALAVKENSGIKSIDDLNNTIVATSFPSLTKEFLDKENIEAKVVEIQGSVELAPNIGMADSIIDLVSTGFTLKTNQLKILKYIDNFESVLISKNNLDKIQNEMIDRFVMRIDSALTARKYKYILMNVPKSKLNDISGISPGMKSPTITPLAKEGWLSVQTVIEEETFWEVLEELKKNGAEDILVMPIEQIVR
jgi:ATP phosphoribosyltransferase